MTLFSLPNIAKEELPGAEIQIYGTDEGIPQ